MSEKALTLDERRVFYDFNLVWEGGQKHAFLYQGGAQPQAWPEGVDVIIQMNKDENPRWHVPPSKYHSSWQIPDGDPTREEQELIKALARQALAFLHEGKNVLVHCSAGLNRSGVVVARTLMYLGYTPDKAIELVQTARGEFALCNPHFRAWLQREGPSLAADLEKKEASS